MLYRSFKEWAIAVKHSGIMLFNALYCVVWLCLIVGLASLFLFVIRQINAFYRRELVAGCIISTIILLMAAGWMITFVNERHSYIQAQHAADSLAYDLSKFTQMYDTAKTIVINGDTVKSY